jgi:hypothetical protein
MTTFYDVFNGDADGICALHQLRLEAPRAAELVTGVKREITLVGRISARAGDEVTVLDVSFSRNADAVAAALNAGARVRYFDHHYAGDIPSHPNLDAVIDTGSDVCTSLLVDRVLDGRRRVWAVVAAFGDNLAAAAHRAAVPLRLAAHGMAQLQELGECLNYNAYGESVDDLNYPPADLYRAISAYEDPFAFIAGEPVLDVLRQSRADDLYLAGEIVPEQAGERTAVYVLPDAGWSRRVGGSFANQLAAQHPARAHAILTRRAGGFTVSVRAPVEAPRGADALCRQFTSGGGRAGAAGIDFLPDAGLGRFADAFAQAFAA